MPTFTYKAYDRAGNTVSGQIEAAGHNDAAAQLRSGGLFPAGISQAGEVRSGVLAVTGRITSQAVSDLTRQLGTLITAGTSLSEALSVLAENTDNGKLRSVLNGVRENITGGSSLSKALEAYPEVFSPFYRGLVASAEASGSLDAVMPKLADYLEARARIIRDVRAALTYPALMALVGVGVLSFLFIFVIPRITRIFEETHSSLPLITKALIAATGIFTGYWPFIAGGLGAGAWFFLRSYRTPRTRAAIDSMLLKMPIAGKIISDFYISNLARTMGTLLKGGVHMLKALEITRNALGHPVFGAALEKAAKDCAEGAPLSQSLKKEKCIPPILVHMIGVGERSGNMDELLLRTADAYELDFEAGVKKMMNLLEPLLIMAMGLLVGFIVLAILLPIFQLNQVVK